ncbi:MAG: V-type ATP synthase subunit K [Sedimentisphaeraceae bacterium JB056]
MEIGIGSAIAFVGVALSVFLAGSGSAIGIGAAGRAAAGVLADKPERYTTNLLLVALPSTQGIYGLVGALLVMFNMGAFGGQLLPLSLWDGLILLAACLAMGVSGLVSGIYQGRVCAAGILMAAKRQEMAIKAGVMYAVMVELYALFGLVIQILIYLKGVNWTDLKVAAGV